MRNKRYSVTFDEAFEDVVSRAPEGAIDDKAQDLMLDGGSDPPRGTVSIEDRPRLDLKIEGREDAHGPRHVECRGHEDPPLSRPWVGEAFAEKRILERISGLRFADEAVDP